MQKNNILYKKLFGETIIYGIGSILPRVIVLALNFLIVSQSNDAAYAMFSNLYACIAFVNIVLTFGFETGYFRFSAEEGQEKKTFNTSFLFLGFTSLAFLILCMVFTQPIANILDYSANPEYIRWFAWIAFFDTLCVIPLAYLRYNNMPIKYTFVRVVQSVFHTLFTIALYYLIPLSVSQSLGMKETISFPFFSNLAASILGFILVLPIVFKVRLEFCWNLFKRIISYSWPIMIAGLAFTINENLDKTLQYTHIDKGDAGAYGACYKIAVIMTLFVTAYRMGIEPFFFKQMNSENAKKTYATITEFFTIFSSIVALGILTNLSWIKYIMVPNSTYWRAIDIVPIIIIANVFFGIYYNLSTWYKVTDRTMVGTFISWIGAILTLVINLVFLKEYGYMVSAWATLIAYLVMMVISYLLGQKNYPIPYPAKKLAAYLILFILLSIISFTIFDQNVIWGNILLLLYCTTIFYFEKNKVKQIVSKFKKN